MEMIVNVPMIDRRYSVDVGYNNTYKSSKSRSFATASACCGKRVQQKKLCSSCEKDVDTKESTHKIWKLGKEDFLVPIEKLDEALNNIAKDETEIVVKSVVKRKGFELPYHRIDSAKWTSPAKKRTRDYVELKELCKEHILIGEAVFKNNSYEVGLLTDDDMIVVVLIATQDRMTNKPSNEEIKGIEINPELLKVQKDVLDSEAVTEYDFTKYTNKRAEQVDDLLEKVALGEELPVTEKKDDTKAVADDMSEIERLKAKLKAKAEASA